MMSTMENRAAKTAWCRSYQAALKVANYLLGYRTPEVLEGPGCVRQLPGAIAAHGIGRVLLVCGPHLYARGATDSLMEALAAQGIEAFVFCDLQANPTDRNVEAGYASFAENACEAIIAFGGGSPLDCAKAIAVKVAHPTRPVTAYQGVLKVRAKLVPLFAVPTTAGTGSETTIASVITDAATHHKASINDPALMPMLAVLDPELTVSLPPHVTATTGMDALCHAVESYTNATYCTKLENDYACRAVRLIFENLPRAYEQGDDLTARQNLQRAAFYAGRAFTRGCVGYVHAVGHTLGGLYGVPHGLAMAVILPKVLRQYGPAVYPRLAELADACGIKANTTAERALTLIARIEQLNEQLGIPAGFDCIRDEDIPQMIAWADAEANPLYPVPVVWCRSDFERLIGKLKVTTKQ